MPTSQFLRPFILHKKPQANEGNLLHGMFMHRELDQMEPRLNFQVPTEGLELVILLHTQY